MPCCSVLQLGGVGAAHNVLKAFELVSVGEVTVRQILFKASLVQFVLVDSLKAEALHYTRTEALLSSRYDPQTTSQRHVTLESKP